MKRYALFIVILALMLLCVQSSAFNIRLINVTGTVYIRADGSVDPSNVPIQWAQCVYTFIGDINASLVLQRDNIVIDGAGHYLVGNGTGIGVDLTGRTNATVENLNITEFQNGVYLNLSYNCTLSGNSITSNTDHGIVSDFWNICVGNVIVNNSVTGNGEGVLLNPSTSYTYTVENNVSGNGGDGIYLYGTQHDLLSGNRVTTNQGFGILVKYSLNTTLSGNNMTGNLYNLHVDGSGLDSFSSNHIDVSNTVEGKPVYYWVNRQGVTVPSDAGCVGLVNCSDVTVRNLNIRHSGEGVLLVNSNNCTITENNMANNWMAIWVMSSNNNNITHNNITETNNFDIENSISTIISFNIIANSDNASSTLDFSNAPGNYICYNNFTNVGIDLSGSSNTIMSNNSILGGSIDLSTVSNTTVSCNNISDGGTGVSLDSSSNNVIFHNDVEATKYESIYLSYSSCNNNITCNRIANTSRAAFMFTYSSNGNIVYENEVAGNKYAVELIFDCYNNVFCHNSFVNNTHSVLTSFGGTDTWDLGYPLGGNYWSDYSGTDVHSGPGQNDGCSDGIGDTPYIIDLNNLDRYPLMKPYAGPHDLGVQVCVSKTVVPEGYNLTLWMNATVLNCGVQAETFNFTSQLGAAFEEQTLTLMERNSTAFSFSLNVAGWSKGNYTLDVHASPVPGETDTADNAYDGLLAISILGDINGDCKVDMRDVGYAARRFLAGPTNPLWDPNADVNDDLIINMRDIGTICRHYGESWL